jgi:hypothetical protein
MQPQCDSHDALIERFLGSRYLGRRYLRYAELEALGICDNRGSLVSWMRGGGFPLAIRIPGRTGKTLVWDAVEVAQHIAQRCAAREIASPDNDEGAPSQRRPCSNDSDPLTAGRKDETCPYTIKAT